MRALIEKHPEVREAPFRYRATWGGQFENLDRARRRLTFVIPVTIAIIFKHPFFTFG